MSDIRKLNLVHYKTLRIIEYDWKKKKMRADLDKLGRAKPSLWAKYANGNLVLKTLKREFLVYIFDKLGTTCYLCVGIQISTCSLTNLGLNLASNPLKIGLEQS